MTFAGNTVDITVLTSGGVFFDFDSDGDFAGLDISNLVGPGQDDNLTGAFSAFNITDGSQVANITGEVVAAAVVPVPASAVAIAPMMLGLFGYRKYKKRRQLA